MIFRFKKILGGLGILFLMGMALPTYAQTTPGIVPDDLGDGNSIYETGPTENDVVIDFTPENPGAFQDVTLRTDSDYIDLNRYNASWYVNGQKIEGGIGKRSITIKTKGYGQKTTVIILIQLPDTLIKKTLIFIPQEMTLAWEATDSYVPPFYQGKKLLAREGIVKIVAIPNFNLAGSKPFDPTTAVYRWSRNDNVVSTATGYGKSSFSFKNNKIRSTESVSVTASDVLGENQAVQSINISTYNPKILFYEKNTKTGIQSPFSKKTVVMFDNATIVGEPFFFSTQNNNPNNLSFSWTMNNSPITLSDINNKKSITLQNSEGNGHSTLGLATRNPNSVFQSAANQLSILFKKN